MFVLKGVVYGEIQPAEGCVCLCVCVCIFMCSRGLGVSLSALGGSSTGRERLLLVGHTLFGLHILYAQWTLFDWSPAALTEDML